jgi:hypothetical protein
MMAQLIIEKAMSSKRTARTIGLEFKTISSILSEGAASFEVEVAAKACVVM